MSSSVADYILERLTPIYGIPTEIGPDEGSIGELLKRWAAAEGISLSPKALWDRYTLAGAAGASIQDKAYDFWSRGLLKSGISLPGTAGNYLSTPDSVLNSVTGDIDIRVYVKLTDWTPADTNTLVAKWGASPSFLFRIEPAFDGRPNFIYSSDGSTTINPAPAVGVGALDGTALWVRVTLDVDNGAGGNDCKYYTSVDGITWTQLGTTITTAGVTSIFNGTDVVTVGGRSDYGLENTNGTIYYAEVRNGIDGPVVAKFDSSEIQVAGTQSPASINGWTLNGSALYRRDDYIRLLGTGGNFLSYPDTVENSVTGDIDLRAKLSMDDWTPAADKVVMSKWNVIASWRLYIDTGGSIRVAWWTAGGVEHTAVSSVSAAFADGTVNWIRATIDVDNGAAGRTVRFYISNDGGTWTQLGSDHVTAGVSSIRDSTDVIEIGSRDGGFSNVLIGNVYYAEVRNGINGTVVASFDARDIDTPWTINGAGWSYEGTSFQGKPVTALDLPGTAGNYASTPDSAGISITGDIDLRAKVAVDDWVTAPFTAIVSKHAGDPTLSSYRLAVLNNTLFFYAPSGADANGVDSSTTLNFSAGEVKWVRATRRQSDGRVQFFTSDDGIAWVQNGTDRIVAAGAAMNDSTAVLAVGGASQLAGKIYYAEVRNGIDGPIVAKFDPSAVVPTGVRTPTTLVQPGGTPNMLIPNDASFETSVAGWGAGGPGNVTLSQSAAQALDGTKSLAMTAVGIGDMAVQSPDLSVVAGKMYTAKINYRAAVTARSAVAVIQWFTAASAYIDQSVGTSAADSAASWLERIVTGVAPPTAAYGRVLAYVSSALATEVHYVDRVSLAESATVWTMNGAAWNWEEVAA